MPEITDLVHPTSVKILKSINSESKNLTDISNELDISRPEISRQLTKLRKYSLVDKDENLNSTTPFGSLILEILSPIEFILLHFDFFQNHPLVNFPSELLYGINSLQKSTLILGTGNVFQRYVEIAKDNHRNFKGMFNTPIPNVAHVVYEEGYFIVPSRAKSPALKHENLSKELNYYEFRKLPDINYDINILDNKFGFVYFPDKNGVPDNNACFFVDDTDGIAFLLSLWDYFWKRSSIFFQS